MSENYASQWEYEVVSMSEQLGDAVIKTALNDLGGRGWELVGSHVGAGGCPRYVFKRQSEAAAPAASAPSAATDSIDPEQERWLRNVSMAEALLSLPEEKRERVFAEVLTDEERTCPSPPDDFYDRVLRYFAEHKDEA